MQDFGKLGAFYLDRAVGHDTPLLCDSKDLVTHAVCVGMTGSGKTGLCIALLEEAAIDGPVLAGGAGYRQSGMVNSTKRPPS